MLNLLFFFIKQFQISIRNLLGIFYNKNPQLVCCFHIEQLGLNNLDKKYFLMSKIRSLP